MIPIIHRAEAVVLRRWLLLPPLGTPSRVLSMRLRRFSRLNQPARFDFNQYEPAATTTASRPPIFAQEEYDEYSSYEPYREEALAESGAKPFVEPTRNGVYALWDRERTLASAEGRGLSAEHVFAHLLHAVRTQDVLSVYSLLSMLPAALHASPEAASFIQAIPRTFITEIFQTLDPLRAGESLDPTHGLVFPEHLQEWSSATGSVDKFGVRRVFVSLFQTLMDFVYIIQGQGLNLLWSEYVVLLRAAGATSDMTAAKRVWLLMDLDGIADHRPHRAYEEFFKARFMTEPLYVQYDISRSRLRPRDVIGHRPLVQQPGVAARFEKLRLYKERSRRFTYGKAPHQTEKDLHWILSSPRPLARVWNWFLNNGVAPDEGLICSYLVACGRVGQYREIWRVLDRYYGLRFSDTEDHRTINFKKDVKSAAAPSIKPSPRLLKAIVDSLGNAGYVILAKKIIEYLSERHSLPIPGTTWSDLLEYTYVHSTQRASKEWAMFEPDTKTNRLITCDDVIAVWDTMTSESHSVQPCFDDLYRYANALMQANMFDEARDMIRLGVEHYSGLTQVVRDALSECLYPAPPQAASDRFLRAKAQQHYAWYLLQRCCGRWIKFISVHAVEAPDISEQIIPAFVAEFEDFMPSDIEYRTTGGNIIIASDTALRKTAVVKGKVTSALTSVWRSDLARPVLDEDGNHEVKSTGHNRYVRGSMPFQQTFRRTHRVRRRQRWEHQGPFAYCLRTDGDGALAELSPRHMARCVEW